MTIWIALFIVVFLISLVLAFRSLSDYRESPLQTKVQYSVYLIQKPENFNLEVLKKLQASALQDKLLLSFERLFRGDRKALVIFGASLMLRPYIEELGLLELEDYSQKVGENFASWEVGKKNSNSQITQDILVDVPKLDDMEQFWWQLVLQPRGKSWQESLMLQSKPDDTAFFNAIIRVVLQDGGGKRFQDLKDIFTKLGENQGLAMLPQSYSSAQLVKFYQQRSMPKISTNKNETMLTLSEKEAGALLGFK